MLTLVQKEVFSRKNCMYIYKRKNSLVNCVVSGQCSGECTTALILQVLIQLIDSVKVVF